jgi:hypothetical protein
MYDGTSPLVLTAPADGVYSVTSGITVTDWNGEATGGIQIMKGTDEIASSTGPSPITSPFFSSLNASSIVALDAGESVQVQFVSTPGADAVAIDGDESQFTLNWIGPQ